MFTFPCWRITFKTFGINHVSKLSWLLKADPDTYSHLPFSRSQHDSGLTIFRDHFSATKKKNLFFKNWSIVDSQNIYWYIHTYVHAYKDAFLLQVNTRYWLWFSVMLVFFHSVTSDPFVTHRDCSPPGSSVHGIFWARSLKWVAISFSRDWTHVSLHVLHCRRTLLLSQWGKSSMV